MSTITITDNGREYEHGEISATRISQMELKLDITSDLVISPDHLDEFKEELEDLIKRYAL
jgi:hypothetical protein